MTGRDRSRAATTSKMECFVILTKHSILDVAAALDPSLTEIQLFLVTYIFQKKKKKKWSFVENGEKNQ